jgi:hypothetical protein
MFKRANRGALPAIVILGVLIGASMAVASPAGHDRGRPSPRPASSPTPTTSSGVGENAPIGTPGTGRCARSISALARDHRHHPQAIALVLRDCQSNPQAAGLVNAAVRIAHGRDAGGGHGHDVEGGNAPGVGDGSSGGSGSVDRSGSDGSGSSGSGDSAGGDAQKKARGHHDGKGNKGQGWARPR